MRMVLERITCILRSWWMVILVAGDSRAYFKRSSDGVYATNENSCLKSVNIGYVSMGRKRLSNEKKKKKKRFLINPATHCVSHTIAADEWICFIYHLLLLLLQCVVIVWRSSFNERIHWLVVEMRCEFYVLRILLKCQPVIRWTAKSLQQKQWQSIKRIYSLILRETKMIRVFLFSNLQK